MTNENMSNLEKELVNKLYGWGGFHYDSKVSTITEKIALQDKNLKNKMQKVKILGKELNRSIIEYAQDICCKINDWIEWTRGDRDKHYLLGESYVFIKNYFKMELLGRFEDFSSQIKDNDRRPDGGVFETNTVYRIKDISGLLFVEDELNKGDADLCKGKQAEEYFKAREANGEWKYTGIISRLYSSPGRVFLFRRLLTPLNESDKNTSKIDEEAERINASIKEEEIKYAGD